MPRAGSTLLQRILAGHGQISSNSEPWILLPLLYTLRKDGVYAEYAHISAAIGIESFYGSLPGGRDEYLSEIKELATRLYARASDEGATYFLDKTPRYHLIVEELLRLFPNSKALFLWRNPLSIIASLMDAWADGRWNLHRFRVDLYEGPVRLTNAYREHRDSVFSLRYEDLIAHPEDTVRDVLDYLDLEPDDSLVDSFSSVKLAGRMGDPTGSKRYGTISSEPMSKWKRLLANPLRKAWAANYLRWIGEERLAEMGYDLEDLLDQLRHLPTSMRYVGSDVVRRGYGLAYALTEPRQVLQKLKKLPHWRKVRVHT